MSGTTTQEQNLIQQVELINQKLRSFGREAVQEIKVGGMVRYGYKPQYVSGPVTESTGSGGDAVGGSNGTSSNEDVLPQIAGIPLFTERRCGHCPWELL